MTIATHDIEGAFRQAMGNVGLVTSDTIIDDGKLHRINIEGDKPGEKNGWYVLYPDSIPAGAFGCWKRGISETWSAKGVSEMSLQEKESYNRRIEAARAEREREEKRLQAEAQARAQKIWKDSKPAPGTHSYLIKKQIKPHGLRIHNGSLVVPLRNSKGTIQSLQFIDENGEKRFLPGGRVSGCYFSIGKSNGVIYIAEGFSTAAAIHESNNGGVATAFSAGNLGPVGTALKEKYPGVQIVVAGDDDRQTKGNPGRTRAMEAARAVGGLVALPVFKDGQAGTDFNDLFLAEGMQVVKQQLEAAVLPPESTAQSEINVREPVCIRMSDVEPEEVQWLWKPYIPLGKLTILEGDPGVGKTWLALQLAAIISRGNPFPGSDGIPRERRNPGNALYMTAEDGLADTLRPRLDAAEADTSRVIVLDGWRQKTEEGEQAGLVTLQDIPIIEQALVEYRPALLVVDPLQAFFGSNVDYHRANETRPVLAKLGRLAEKYGVAILCIRHLGKSKKERAIYQGLGSIDFSAAARSMLLVGKDPDNLRQRVMAHVKNNLDFEGPSIGFELSEGRLLWTGISDLTVEALSARQGSEFEMSAVDEACEWFRETLAEGPVKTKEILKQAEDQGLSKATVRRAKKRLGIKSIRQGFEKDSTWLWELPVDAQNPRRCSHTDSEHLRTESGSFLDGDTIDAQGDNIPKDEHLRKSTPKAPLKTQSELVCCGDCCSFKPDPQNPGKGIGECVLDAPFTKTDPPRPDTFRTCRQFEGVVA